MLTISLNFNSVFSKNNILKYVSKNDKFFIYVLTQHLMSFLLPLKVSLMISLM